MIDVFIVVYHPDVPQLHALLDALLAEHCAARPLLVRIWHNDGDVPAHGEIAAVYANCRSRGLNMTLGGGEGNLGFGGGVNRLLRDSDATYVLLLNQDAIPEACSVGSLVTTAQGDDIAVAAWEMRQIPFEHPKAYDPVTLDTEWVSGAAVLFRASALLTMRPLTLIGLVPACSSPTTSEVP